LLAENSIVNREVKYSQGTVQYFDTALLLETLFPPTTHACYNIADLSGMPFLGDTFPHRRPVLEPFDRLNRALT
jgi:hypothetical protein